MIRDATGQGRAGPGRARQVTSFVSAPPGQPDAEPAVQAAIAFLQRTQSLSSSPASPDAKQVRLLLASLQGHNLQPGPEFAGSSIGPSRSAALVQGDAALYGGAEGGGSTWGVVRAGLATDSERNYCSCPA